MGTAPEYHGFGQGLVTWDQVRAQAWSLRTLAQAEYIAPDADPLKAVLRRAATRANVAWYETHFLRGADSNNLGLLWQANVEPPYDGGRSIAPWQDDFFTWALGYTLSLGDVSALVPSPCLEIQISGRPYDCARLLLDTRTRLFDDSTGRVGRSGLLYDLPKNVRRNACAQAAIAENMRSRAPPARARNWLLYRWDSKPGEMVENASGTDGYSAFLQPALAAAVDAGAPHAAEAWKIFRSRPVQPDYSSEPGWDIVPRSGAPPDAP